MSTRKTAGIILAVILLLILVVIFVDDISTNHISSSVHYATYTGQSGYLAYPAYYTSVDTCSHNLFSGIAGSFESQDCSPYYGTVGQASIYYYGPGSLSWIK